MTNEEAQELFGYPSAADYMDWFATGGENGIEAVPTIFFVKDGEILERVAGLLEQDDVMEKISRHYYE